MKINVLDKGYKELSSTVADIIESQIKEQTISKLALPTGDTPLGMYEELVNRELDWKSVITFNLDVYLIFKRFSRMEWKMTIIRIDISSIK